MITEKSWKEFRECGMLWWINMILHTFGWAIVLNIDDDGRVVEAYPSRVEFRGFDEASNTKGYIAVSAYMAANAAALAEESKE